MGLASYTFLWPAARFTQSRYLKELFVSKDHQGKGLGRLVMAKLEEIAMENGCRRIEWTTDSSTLLRIARGLAALE
ncbi:hypothetical protein Lfu02_00980 [Longispora fulva]|uniref:GNAT family N-acetyltransferase n=1 Tax=Longispora fulva TaxID=619741 RepID=UPI001A5004DF|nr:hypothetical protein Lfu02_00980 [Longispora fulva]